MAWWGWLAATLGGIILIANAAKAIRDLFAPALAMEGRLKEIEKHDTKDIERFAGIEKRFCEQEETNQAILKGLVALINHELDGNSVEGLRKTRDALLTQIIER